ncbi:MAG: Yip1 family protein [bacterium]
MEKLIARVKTILVTPEKALQEVKDEAMNITETMKQYVAILAAVPAAATFYGLLRSESFFSNLIYSAFVFAIGLAGVFVSGKIIDAFAPHFNSTKNDLNAFKLSLCAFTPALLAGLFTINPDMWILWLLGSFYGVYVLYLGVPVLMETPEDKRIAYAAVNAVVIYVVMLILLTLARSVAFGRAADALR